MTAPHRAIRSVIQKVLLSRMFPVLGVLAVTVLGLGDLEAVNVPVPPKAIIKGYAPGSHKKEIQYKSPEEGKYSKEYIKIIPPADTNRKKPLPKGEKAIVLNRDTNEMDSQDFTKLKFQGIPTPFPIGTVIKVIKPANLNLYKEDKSIVADSELTYVVGTPAVPFLYDPTTQWLHPLATKGESVAWARGKAGWHVQKGGNISLQITLPNGKGDSATLKLVPRRHVVIIVGGSSLHKDYAHALEIKDDEIVIPHFISSNPSHANHALKDYVGKKISTLSFTEFKGFEKAVALFKREYKPHDFSPMNFSNKGRDNGKFLVGEECEVHLVVNASAIARRANKKNVFQGLKYKNPKTKKETTLYKRLRTWSVLGSLIDATDNYRTDNGKGKSNPMVKSNNLAQAIKDIANKIKIDDIIYFGHSAPGFLYYEYGSFVNKNDGYQPPGSMPQSGVRDGQARSSTGAFLKPDIFDPAFFIGKNKPTFYHHGCRGWTPVAEPVVAPSFCEKVRTACKLVVSVGVNGRTNYESNKGEGIPIVLNIVCDGKKVKIAVPKPSGTLPYIDEPK